MADRTVAEPLSEPATSSSNAAASVSGGSAAIRLHGVRVAYDDASSGVRAWVESQLGAPVVHVTPRTGGMSPAVAASVRGANGARAFVKAVSASINPETPNHFRHEIEVLSRLAPAPYRADLLGTYDDGDWVALLLEDIEGDHPHWEEDDHRVRVLEAVQAQTRELTPAPDVGVTATAVSAFDKYLAAFEAPTERELGALPDWVRQEVTGVREILLNTRSGLVGNTFCHWDIRHDNILMRRDTGQPVLLDWGMSRLGPLWGDTMCLGLEWVETPLFDEMIASLNLQPTAERDVTGFLTGLGCYSAMMSTQPAPMGLPHLPRFRAELARRTLEGAQRRRRS